MAFESLADKLQNVFKNLTGKGRLSESDVKAGLKEVKMALLEADVSFKVVKQFINSVQERAIGTDVLNGLNPGQMVIKIVNDELATSEGSEMMQALAIAVIFGLTLSTVVTLIFIPVLYMWMNERKRKSNARKTAKRIAKNAKQHAEELARERAAQNNAKSV